MWLMQSLSTFSRRIYGEKNCPGTDFARTFQTFSTFHFSGMAINLTMMFGRIGSVLGTNVVGFTLDQYCSPTFAVSAIMMIGCAVLAFFIPKIRRIDGRKDNKWHVCLKLTSLYLFLVKHIISYECIIWPKIDWNTSVPLHIHLWRYQMLRCCYGTWKVNWACHWPRAPYGEWFFTINQQHERPDAHEHPEISISRRQAIVSPVSL